MDVNRVNYPISTLGDLSTALLRILYFLPSFSIKGMPNYFASKVQKQMNKAKTYNQYSAK